MTFLLNETKADQKHLVLYIAREKKAKLYSWQAFVFGEIVAEVPYLLVCALLYFAPWYAVVGFSFAPGVAGPVYLQMTLYEFLYTGIGQFVAAYAPNAVFAALVNPLLIGMSFHRASPSTMILTE